jgi:two-component system sensor histidine kinase KdpD
MGEQNDRPDPDLLLRKVKAEEARSRRGKLKIFFGFAPGVGKTYRMLQVARDLVYDQHADVVVGIVETHGRTETAALILGLELLARRKVEYRGRALEELDLDAALARKPKILIVDELAHTNAPGSRHAKRWQDVRELVEAGIDVFTTLNVQHVESLNDVVAQITHVQVRETLPDSVLDEADEMELVDIAPEELLARLAEGKVYLPEQARRAADHFFKRGNLLALRELALRRMAQTVDEDVREYREEHGVQSTWPAGERIMVCVGPSPSSGRLIRAGARVAAGLRSPWVAAYVAPTALEGMSDQDREQLESHLRLAESLGASVARLGGGRISEAVLGYARRQNVTRILLGKPTHSRLRDRIRGSLLDEIVRGSGEIDVLVIGASEEDREPRPVKRGASPQRATPYLFAVAVVALTTALAAGLRALFPVPDLSVLYMVAVMVAAIRHGRRSSILAAALSVGAYDFFFVPPYLTFAVADVRYVLTFAMMFGVGWVVGELTTRLRRQERDAVEREEQTGVLYALSRELGSADDLDRTAAVLARRAAEVFDATAFVLAADVAEGLLLIGSSPAGRSLDKKDLSVARWALEHGRLAGFGTDTLPGGTTLCAPLMVGGRLLGVLALEPRTPIPLRLEQREFLEAFCRQGAFAFDRLRLAAEAQAGGRRL